jgi:hypothetical protein
MKQSKVGEKQKYQLWAGIPATLLTVQLTVQLMVQTLAIAREAQLMQELKQRMSLRLEEEEQMPPRRMTVVPIGYAMMEHGYNNTHQSWDPNGPSNPQAEEEGRKAHGPEAAGRSVAVVGAAADTAANDQNVSNSPETVCGMLAGAQGLPGPHRVEKQDATNVGQRKYLALLRLQPRSASRQGILAQ